MNPCNRYMKTLFHSSVYVFLFSVAISSCTKGKDDFTSDTINDYFPLQVGKYITYRVDSIVFVNFQSVQEIKKYQVRNIVDAQILDAQGRPTYRIRQVIRDTAGIQPWADNATLFYTPFSKSVEVVDNNLRYIKLQLPIRENFSWKGNSYITDQLGGDLFFYSNWDYTYQDVGQPFSVPGTNINVDSTVTIAQRDEILPDPSVPFNENMSYYEKTYSQEVYGKHIGLVYRNFIHWEWQRPNLLNPGKYIGYGIILKYLDSN